MNVRTMHWEQLTPELYEELRRIAKNILGGRYRGWTIETVGLLNEACIRLCGLERMQNAERAEILLLAATTMRTVLVDEVRKRAREKRPPAERRIPFDEVLCQMEDRAVNLLVLNDLLAEFATSAPHMAKAVDLLFFAGLSQAEVADHLGMALRTFQREWKTTRAWLRTQLG